jgi:hypothetical protein
MVFPGTKKTFNSRVTHENNQFEIVIIFFFQKKQKKEKPQNIYLIDRAMYKPSKKPVVTYCSTA